MPGAVLSSATSWLVTDGQGALSSVSPVALLGRVAALEAARDTANAERESLRGRVAALEARMTAEEGAQRDTRQQLDALKAKKAFLCLPSYDMADNGLAAKFCSGLDESTCNSHIWCQRRSYYDP